MRDEGSCYALRMSGKTILAPHVAVDPEVRGGRPFIDGTGITIDHIVREREAARWSVEEIAEAHDLSLAQVYAALAYYWDHKQELDRRMAEDEAFIEEMKQAYPSRLREQLA